MIDLQELFQTLDRLEPDERQQVQQYLEKHSIQTSQDEDVEERIAAIHAGLEAFREGLTQEEMVEIAAAINGKPLTPPV